MVLFQFELHALWFEKKSVYSSQNGCAIATNEVKVLEIKLAKFDSGASFNGKSS